MKLFYKIFSERPFKPLYHAFVPRPYRRKWEYEYKEIPKQEAVAEFWHKAIADYEEDKIPKYNLEIKKTELVGKKIIWQYWAQGIENAPDLVKLCFKSVEKYKGDYEVIRLTDATVSDYLLMPNFVKEKRSEGFKTVFFSDLLRVSLINNYGGVWLDASILLTNELSNELWNQNFFIFSRDLQSENKDWGLAADRKYFNWNENFKVKHLSSIIFGKPHTQIVTYLQDLLLYFWKTQTSISHYFFFQILMNELKVNKIVDFDLLVKDDTLPHLLKFDMNKAFNEQRFRYIMESASLHKLSYHNKLQEYTKKGDLSFYGYLKTHY